MYADGGMFSGQVNWTEPVATDNLDAVPSVTSKFKPPKRFSQGTHVITYTAVDQAGNRANCTFAIKVIGIKRLFLDGYHNNMFIIRGANHLYAFFFVFLCHQLSTVRH